MLRLKYVQRYVSVVNASHENQGFSELVTHLIQAYMIKKALTKG